MHITGIDLAMMQPVCLTSETVRYKIKPTEVCPKMVVSGELKNGGQMVGKEFMKKCQMKVKR